MCSKGTRSINQNKKSLYAYFDAMTSFSPEMDGWVQPHDSPTELQEKGIFKQYGWVIFLILSFSIAVYQLLVPGPKGCGVPVFLEDKFKNQQQRAAQYFLHPRRLVTDGYKKFGDQIWGIETSQGVKLVLPITLLDELKSHPALSFTESISHDAMTHYTGVGGLEDHVVQVFKAKFNPTLAAYTPIFYNIIQREVKLAFPDIKEWTETSIYDKMIRIVSIVSSRAFYTAQSSDDEEWLTLSQAYVETVLEYLQELKQWPSLTRPFVRFFLPQRTRLVQQWNQARAHLSESIRASSSSRQTTDPPSLFHHLTEADNIQVDGMIHTQMALVVAGIHTTAAALTQLIYDLAVHPESLPELREEISQVYSSVGGDFTKQSLSSLPKLDSWMKESQRLSSADLSECPPSLEYSLEEAGVNEKQQPSNAWPSSP